MRLVFVLFLPRWCYEGVPLWQGVCVGKESHLGVENKQGVKM